MATDTWASLTGTWYLIEASMTAPDETPAHRAEIFLEEDTKGLRGTIGRQIETQRFSEPLAGVQREGKQLSIQMAPRAGFTAEELPVLVLDEIDENRYEGHWMKASATLGPRLRLIRAPNA